MTFRYGKAEIESIIKSERGKEWQKQWIRGSHFRHYYSVQMKVGEMGETSRTKKKT